MIPAAYAIDTFTPKAQKAVRIIRARLIEEGPAKRDELIEQLETVWYEHNRKFAAATMKGKTYAPLGDDATLFDINGVLSEIERLKAGGDLQ